MPRKKTSFDTPREVSDYTNLAPTYGRRWEIESMNRKEFPQNSMLPDAAYRMVADEMNLDGNPSLNMATFVSTWMEPEAEKLLIQGARKNLVDEDEYPQLKIIEDRIIQMEANLFNIPDHCAPIGVTTIGSSEAIMLGLLAHKWTWRKKRLAGGKDALKPNIIFGADAHTCWEKFARYFDVEMRIIPMRQGKYTINADDVSPLIDKYTIAVGAIVGTTFTGQIDDVKGINKLLVELKKKTGQDIPIHVDAASGGFILPFVQPDFVWDFRLEQVRSINTSNHKYGLVYAGMGSLVFRDRSDLPKELPFEINYLGGIMQNYSLNFSKGSAMLLAQYYMFFRMGRNGYKKITSAIMHNAHYMEEQLLNTGHFDLLTDSNFLPVVVLKPKVNSSLNVYDISDNLRKFGWIVPAYSLPPNAEKISVLRLVVKENFSRDLAEKLIKDIKYVISDLNNAPTKKQSHSPALKSKVKSHGVC